MKLVFSQTDVMTNSSAIVTRLAIYIFSATFLLFGHICIGQTVKDSAIYWVNQKYLDCIDSGKSVCKCQEQNNFLILDIDTALNKLTIMPSIYYSRETLEFKIKRDEQNFYTVLPAYGIDTGSILNIKENLLAITSPKEAYVFTKIKVKRLDNWTQGDLSRQIGVINCRPLLKYSIRSCSDTSKLLLTQSELSDYILQGRITINCSDDYHYNEMYIRNPETQFFMVYESNTIKIYREPLRDLEQTVEVAALKDCQVYLKSK